MEIHSRFLPFGAFHPPVVTDVLGAMGFGTAFFSVSISTCSASYFCIFMEESRRSSRIGLPQSSPQGPEALQQMPVLHGLESAYQSSLIKQAFRELTNYNINNDEYNKSIPVRWA